MKLLIAGVVMLCAGMSFAQVVPPGVTPAPIVAPAPPAQLDISGISGLVADKLKELKGAAIITWAGKPGAASYLPIWTWHTAAGTPLVEFPTIGYRAIQGQKPDAFTTITANLPGISEQVFGSNWFQVHVTKSAFPPIFFGPALLVPLDLNVVEKLQWKDWQKYAAVVASVRLGK